MDIEFTESKEGLRKRYKPPNKLLRYLIVLFGLTDISIGVFWLVLLGLWIISNEEDAAASKSSEQEVPGQTQTTEEIFKIKIGSAIFLILFFITKVSGGCCATIGAYQKKKVYLTLALVLSSISFVLSLVTFMLQQSLKTLQETSIEKEGIFFSTWLVAAVSLFNLIAIYIFMSQLNSYLLIKENISPAIIETKVQPGRDSDLMLKQLNSPPPSEIPKPPLFGY